MTIDRPEPGASRLSWRHAGGAPVTVGPVNRPHALRSRLRRGVFCLLIGLLAAGCAGHFAVPQAPELQRPRASTDFFAAVDRAVRRAGVRDAADAPVTGFPYLRTNRFLVEQVKTLKTEDQFNDRLVWMRELDQAGRERELRNLPQDIRIETAAALGEPAELAGLFARLRFHGEQLMQHDASRPQAREFLLSVLRVPDEYATHLRVLGLYPLALVPVSIVHRRAEREFMRWHRTPYADLETLGTLTVYLPKMRPAYDRRRVRLLMEAGKRNPGGVPRPGEAAARELAGMFAPRILQDVAGDYDRIGAVVWNGEHIGIDAARPTCYYYLTHGYFDGRVVLQINYVFWYAARSGPLAPSIEKGNLDGLTVRVSLQASGSAVMIDIMNNCGCYHFFVPDRERIARVLPNPRGFDAWVPGWMPAEFPRKPLSLRVNTGWHQVVNVGAGRGAGYPLTYRLVPYERLESIRRGEGRFESLFTPAGIAKQTGRIEPLLLFPMGIPAVGSMRQRGHHAIILVGRAHFDDPHLFDRNFEYRPLRPEP
jgi:hypothetical protein